MLSKAHEERLPLFQLLQEFSDLHMVETFFEDLNQSSIDRIVKTIDKDYSFSLKNLVPDTLNMDLAAQFDYSWLRTQNTPITDQEGEQITIADLFSGCGGLTLGVVEACRAVGLIGKPVLAMDVNSLALDTYIANFPTAKPVSQPIESILDGELGDPITEREKELFETIGSIDILIGGPPCQGHSDLNNHTRRNDPKNTLYLKMARFAEVFKPRHIIIENVPAAKHDKAQVVGKTSAFLESLGYNVDSIVLNSANFGVAQRRKRFFLVASLTKKLFLEKLYSIFGTEERSFWWACHDLEDFVDSSIFNSAAKHSSENIRRIDYLFDNNLYDLPDSQRPDCHKLKPHSYKSVYGRLKWEEPARTITSGFGSMGQGRFVHPSQRRSITPHEAARLQFFPDFFRFPQVGRRALQEMIGNAVPSKLSYVIGLELLR